MDALISIIVPVYNTKEYLKRCVSSLLDQTYHHLEIILVDDGSTDDSGSLCDALAGEDNRIRVFHKANGGSSSARNLGLSEARGEYVGFVDSDDYVSKDMYELLLGACEKYQVRCAQIGRDEMDEQGNLLPNICEPPTKEEPIYHKAFFRELLMHRGDCSFCTKLLKRDLFNGRSFPEGVLNEDFHLLIEMLPDIGCVLSLPGQAYHVCYRVGSNSRMESKKQFSRVFADCVDNADYAMEIVRSAYPQDRELETIALRFGVFQRLEYMLHIPIRQMEKDNLFYRGVKKWLRRNLISSVNNPYLTMKNKVYHILFAIAPKTVRIIHAKKKGFEY